MRRISLQTIQKIFILFVCIWLIILFNNVSNLPVSEDEEQKDYSISSSSSRRRRRQEITRRRIYGNDKRKNSYSNLYSKSNTDNTDNINVNNTTAAARNMYDSNKYDNDNKKKFHMNKNNKHIFLGQTTYVDDEDNNDDDEPRSRNRRPKSKKRHNNNDNNDDADYDDFNNDYKESSLRRRPSRRRGNNRKNIDLLLPKPIIVMGFPKAGTSSIFSFFQRQGLNSQHWYCCQRKFYLSYYELLVD
jgi:hypothetical protein